MLIQPKSEVTRISSPIFHPSPLLYAPDFMVARIILIRGLAVIPFFVFFCIYPDRWRFPVFCPDKSLSGYLY